MADPHSITLPGAAGGSLVVQQWPAAGSPLGVVMLVHGIGRHSGRFPKLVAGLTGHGYAVLGLDLPGHGRSSGRRGHIRHWGEFRQAVMAAVQLAEQQSPALPRFLVGHSLGGTVVLEAMLQAELQTPGRVQGTVLANPALGARAVPPLRLLLARLLAPLLPALTLSTGIPLALSSRDPQVLSAAASDPLRHSRGSLRLASEYLRTAAWIRRHPERCRGPLLLLCSGDDRVVNPEPARAFFAAAASTDKTWLSYPASYHDLFEDLDHAQVLADLLAWLDAHRP